MARSILELRVLRYTFCSLHVSRGHETQNVFYSFMPLSEQKTHVFSIQFQEGILGREEVYNQSHLFPMYVYHTSFFSHFQSFTSLHFCLVVIVGH